MNHVVVEWTVQLKIVIGLVVGTAGLWDEQEYYIWGWYWYCYWWDDIYSNVCGMNRSTIWGWTVLCGMKSTIWDWSRSAIPARLSAVA